MLGHSQSGLGDKGSTYGLNDKSGTGGTSQTRGSKAGSEGSSDGSRSGDVKLAGRWSGIGDENQGREGERTVVVVGSGLAGLTAAITAFEVCLCVRLLCTNLPSTPPIIPIILRLHISSHVLVTTYLVFMSICSLRIY